MHNRIARHGINSINGSKNDVSGISGWMVISNDCVEADGGQYIITDY